MSAFDRLKSIGSAEAISPPGRFLREELAEFILNSHSDTSTSSQAGDNALSTQLSELKLEIREWHRETNSGLCELKAELAQARAEMVNMRTENTQIRGEMDKLFGTVAAQQKMLEHLDAKERACNVIITGLSETNDVDGARSDTEKVGKVFDEIGAGTSSHFTTKRLGPPRQDSSARPILAVLDKAEKRSDILTKAAALKNSQSLGTVRIKKDQHPAIRREWRRLYEAQERESAKPENAGHSIEFDRKKRVILRDGVVIDRWSMSFQ